MRISVIEQNKHSKTFTYNNNLLLLILFSAFGPYLSKLFGIRLEHVVIYPLFIITFIYFILTPRGWLIPFSIQFFLLSFLFATGWTLLVSYLRLEHLSALKIMAGLENYIQPIALVFVLSRLFGNINRQEKEETLKRSCFFIFMLLTINSFFSAAEIFVNTWPVVQYFVREETGTGISVWKNAVSMGRYCGIFNQPLEAGLAYSIGLASWIYWAQVTPEKSFLKKAIFLSAIIIGGSLSVSKVFLIGGIPVCFVYALWNKNIKAFLKPKFCLMAFFSLAFFVMFAAWGFGKWSGTTFFLRLFQLSPSSNDLLSFYTAGRLGYSESGVSTLFRETLRIAPIQGFGFGGYDGALDNGYLEFFVQGGIIGLIIYLFVLISFLFHGFRYYSKTKKECRFLLVLMVIVIGAGLGAPVLTINRTSIFLWVLLVLLLNISSEATVTLPSRQ